jgi:hypothetical protein
MPKVIGKSLPMPFVKPNNALFQIEKKAGETPALFAGM